jgi:protein-export membrane protein SecD
MRNGTLRNIIIIVVLLVTAYYLAPVFVKDSLPSFWTQKELKLGLDLQGGMQVVYEVDYSELPDAERDDAVKAAVEIIRNRIDQFGVAEPLIQRSDRNRIIVQLPGLKDIGRAKDLIGKTALLEFKLVADAEKQKQTLEKLDEYLSKNIEKYAYLKEYDVNSEVEEDILEEGEEASEEESEVAEEEVESKIFSKLTSSAGYPFLIEKKDVPNFKKLLEDKKFKRKIPRGVQILLGKEDKNNPNNPRQIFVLLNKAELTGKYLSDARVKIGQGLDPKTSGKPYVALTFNKEGAKKFSTVTGQNINKRLAIVLDNVVYIAPTIQDKIRGGEAQITGIGDAAEAQDVVIVLKAGNLPAPMNKIEERTVGATLGADSIKAGILAAIIGMIIVVIFMIVYYGLSGLIADIAVAVNIAFILAVLAMFEATLTLPGIAGMILTIGMAVDANVLIFERIREELKSGKTVRSAVDAGFNRALITILDANLTTLITAVVLYQFGTGPIRGFAVTLSIGIIGSMFASIVFVKAIFDGVVTNKNREKLSI